MSAYEEQSHDLMTFFTLLYRNLFRNPRRTLLTFLGVLISFFLFVAIFTLLESFNRFLKSENAQVNLFFRPIYMSNFIDGQLPEAYLRQLKSIPLIKHLSPYKVYLGTGLSEDINVFALGVYPEEFPKLRNLEGATPIQLDQFSAEKKGALVGIETLKKNRWKLGHEVIIKGLLGMPDLPIHIVGVLSSKSDAPEIVLVHYEYLKDLLKDEGKFSIALLRVESPYQAPWIEEVVRKRFENSSVPVEIITEKGFLESVLSELESIATSVKIIAWITLVATLFVVGNTLSMSIRERTMEQGVLRTLGFSKLRVFSLYLSESLLLSMLGGFSGGVTACFIFTYWHITLPAGGHGMHGLEIYPYWDIMNEVVVLSLFMGLLSGLPPSFLAMRKKITETLRFAG